MKDSVCSNRIMYTYKAVKRYIKLTSIIMYRLVISASVEFRQVRMFSETAVIFKICCFPKKQELMQSCLML